MHEGEGFYLAVPVVLLPVWWIQVEFAVLFFPPIPSVEVYLNLSNIPLYNFMFMIICSTITFYVVSTIKSFEEHSLNSSLIIV